LTVQETILGKTFETIDDDLAAWIRARQMFFVATAPLSAEGLVNCSPKGLDSFRILDPVTIAYADLVGSGIETVAHIRENRRIVVMFCAFQGPPRIVRLHGQARFHDAKSSEFAKVKNRFEALPGIRGIIEVSVNRIAESCGYGVPKLELHGQRVALTKWAEQKGEQGLEDYQRQNNQQSLDGLPGI
jgi:hypothetical protein